MPDSVRLYAANYEAMRLTFSRLRKEAGLTFDALQELSGVSRMALVNLDHGVTHGSLETWHRVAQVLGVPLSELVARLDDPPRTPAAETSPAKQAALRATARRGQRPQPEASTPASPTRSAAPPPPDERHVDG